MGQTELLPMSKKELLGLIKNSTETQSFPSSQLWDSNPWLVMGPVAAVLIIASIGLLYQQLNQSESLDNATLASDPGESPFTEVDEPIPVAEAQPLQANDDAVEETAILAAASAEPEPPLSDSSLALVTAAERGVNDADIVEPEYEELDASAVAELEPLASVASAERIQQREQSVLTIEPAAPPEPAQVPPSPAESEPASIEQVVAADPVDEPVAEPAEPAEPEDELAAEPAEPAVAAVGDNLTASDSADTSVIIADLEQALERWVSAWENQDLDSYFSNYHAEFEPRYQNSQTAWRQNRQRVIGNAEWIRLEMRELEVIELIEDSIEVHFWLAYESPTYRDDTLKKLVLRRHEGAWLIIEEVNLEVRS